MNDTTSSCLSADRIVSLRDADLSPERLHEIERHLDECPACRTLLDEAAADPAGWAELRLSLADTEPAEHAADESPTLEQMLKLLGPSDDPRMLGRIGTYEIVGVLGRGGMGVVFKGFDAALNRYVAIKLLQPHLATSGAARQRFAREAVTAAAVVDDHVMAILGVAEWQGVPYLVMPYTRGVSLQKRLSEQGSLNLCEILRIGMQTAKGLAAAHAQGLVHRDVKPANILLANGVERVTLTDFGLARAVDDASLTKSGLLAGTPQYMSPEQARGQTVDHRSDLFSLGSVLYALCTGRPPFRADSSYGVLRLITDEDPRPIRELNPAIPDWLCAIIARLMAKHPEDRYATAREVAELLEKCLAHVQQPTAVPLPAELARTSPFRFPISRKAVAMIAAVLLVSLGLAAWQATTPPDIAGDWQGDEWGRVTLKASGEGEYTGTYTDTFGQQPGEILLRWSRDERRYNGMWREGEDRLGELSVRLVGDEIRGAWTADRRSRINPDTPHLADLTWNRLRSPGGTSRDASSGLAYRVPFEVGATYLRGGDRITIEEVRGTADTVKAGNMYEIKGTYRLASQAKATLAAYITDDGTQAKTQRLPGAPTLATQSQAVARGEEKFALILYVWGDGKPHISFYPESGGEGFGHVYFGTGDSVLKKGWWETPPAVSRSPDRDTNLTVGLPPLESGKNPDIATQKVIDGLLARSVAITSGRIEYHLKTVIAGEIISDGDYWFAFSGDSWAKRYPPLENAAVNHDGRLIQYWTTPQMDGTIRRSLRIALPETAFKNAPYPPVRAGTLWEPATSQFIRNNANKARPLGIKAVNGIETFVLEWDVSAADKHAAFHAINELLKDGGRLRIYVAPQLGFALPRIEHVDKFGTVQSSFDASEFQEAASQVHFPMKYVFQEGACTHTYAIKRIEQCNESISDDVFVISIPAGTLVADSRPKSTDRLTADGMRTNSTKEYPYRLFRTGAAYPRGFPAEMLKELDRDVSPTDVTSANAPPAEPVAPILGPATPRREALQPSAARTKPLVLVGHTDWVTGVAFSPDGTRLASSSRDNTLKV